MVYKELELLPTYTPYYVMDEMKKYLDKKEEREYGFFMFQHVLALVNFAKTRQNITESQATELRNILEKIKI